MTNEIYIKDYSFKIERKFFYFIFICVLVYLYSNNDSNTHIYLRIVKNKHDNKRETKQRHSIANLRYKKASMIKNKWQNMYKQKEKTKGKFTNIFSDRRKKVGRPTKYIRDEKESMNHHIGGWVCCCWWVVFCWTCFANCVGGRKRFALF